MRTDVNYQVGEEDDGFETTSFREYEQYDNSQYEDTEEKPSRLKNAINNVKSLIPFVNDEERNMTCSQDFIGIDDIRGGLVFMSNGQIIKILEVLPINFTEKDLTQQAKIVTNFAYGLKQGPVSAHIKIMQVKANLQNFIQNVKEATKNEPEGVKKCVYDYLNHIYGLQNKDARKNRFLYIFEYEGDDTGKKSTDINKVWKEMNQATNVVTNFLTAAGNYVIDYGRTGNQEAYMELLYEYFNPTSRNDQTFNDRAKKISRATRALIERERTEGPIETIQAPLSDYISPRGIKFYPWDYMTMDGKFITYLILKGSSYPEMAPPAAFMRNITHGLDDYDVDFYYKEINRDTALVLLDRVNVISQGISMSNQVTPDKAEKLVNKAQNAKYIKDCMTEADENIYNVCIIITLRADSLEELYNQRSMFLKQKKAMSLYYETAYMNVQKCFEMVQPFMKIDKQIFRDNCHNVTNRSMTPFYCFTAFEMFSDKGYCMGTLMNNTLFSFDNFDSSIFPNPHIFILGTSGAGKTFTELMLTSRMRMHGVRTMFILPLKGHEYRKAVEAMDGSYIPLRPRGAACVNIMEIRPEGEALDASEEELEDAPSLLAKKVTSVLTWFRLLCGKNELTVEEVGELNAIIMEVYSKYGINESNTSIYEYYNNSKDYKLKIMPTISDLFEMVQLNPVVKHRASVLKAWVGSGSCSNMDGQTNIDLENKTIAFDVNEDLIGEELLPAFMYIAFDICYSIAKSNEHEKCAIALDEIWKILAIEDCAKQVFKMIKILRAYGSCAITATQDIEDCLKNQYGRAILTNSEAQILLRMKEEELHVVDQTMTLTEDNEETIKQLPKGYGFFCFGSERLMVNFKASEREADLYNTDINKRKKVEKK